MFHACSPLVLVKTNTPSIFGLLGGVGFAMHVSGLMVELQDSRECQPLLSPYPGSKVFEDIPNDWPGGQHAMHTLFPHIPTHFITGHVPVRLLDRPRSCVGFCLSPTVCPFSPSRPLGALPRKVPHKARTLFPHMPSHCHSLNMLLQIIIEAGGLV
jgi:hypothetical protein